MINDALLPELITTKLHRPSVTGKILIRSRLADVLDCSLLNPLTLICAPAGFGKTTLVSSWIERLAADRNKSGDSVPVAWISLDSSDSDPSSFLRYFITAVRSMFPDACSKADELIHSPIPQQPDLLVSTLSNELSQLPSAFVLVLDDYHTINGDVIHNLLNGLFQYWPQPMHMILVSRSNPPLPLASLRAKGQLTEIRSHDLRFTPTESAMFLDNALSTLISPEAAAILQERTEGWIVGLQLAVLSLVAASDAESAVMGLAGTDAYIADYLVDEVLAQQPPSIQEFLLMTSILDRFCAELCDALTEGKERRYNVRACMEWLEHNNLFVVPLDSTRQWYRYHALFKEMLEQRLKADPTLFDIDDLYRRAAKWFAQQKMMDEALHYAVATGDFNLVAELMEQGLRDVLNREDRQTLERWLNLVPEEIIQNRPGLLMMKAWTLQLMWQLDPLNSLVARTEALFAEETTPVNSGIDLQIVQGQLKSFQSQAAFFQNQPIRSVALSREALSKLPLSWHFVRGGALIFLGMGLQASGHTQEAEQTLLDSYESLIHKNTSFALRHLMSLCFIYHQNGLLEQLKNTAEHMLSDASRVELTIHQCWAHYFRGVVHYERNELDEARRHFEAVIEKRYVTQTLIVNASFYGLILIELAEGRSDSAWQALEALSQMDLNIRGRESERTSSMRAKLMLLQRDMEGASQWVDSLSTLPVDQPLLWLEETHLTKVRILLARGAQDDIELALHTLDALFEIAQRTFNIRFQIEILALRALAFDIQEDPGENDALTVLQQAIQLARVGGFVRLFVDLGPHMRNLLTRLAEHNFSVNTIQQILAEFPDTEIATGRRSAVHISSVAVAEIHEHLTVREIDVLLLLSERLSDKEIANRLGISTMTVKRHATNIYSKLGVKRRWDAVISAQMLGILPPH